MQSNPQLFSTNPIGSVGSPGSQKNFEYREPQLTLTNPESAHSFEMPRHPVTVSVFPSPSTGRGSATDETRLRQTVVRAICTTWHCFIHREFLRQIDRHPHAYTTPPVLDRCPDLRHQVHRPRKCHRGIQLSCRLDDGEFGAQVARVTKH